MEAGGEPDSDWEQRRREKIDSAGAGRRRRSIYLICGTVAVALALIVAGELIHAPRSSSNPAAKPLGGKVSDYNETMVSIPLSSVNGTAKFYKWSGAGKTIRFFAVTGSDGQVRTAFDNAYCCYHKDLGERQDGAFIVCNMCQARYPIDDLNRLNLNATTVSQCCPADLPHTVVGKDVLMRKSDIEAGAYLFKS